MCIASSVVGTEGIPVSNTDKNPSLLELTIHKGKERYKNNERVMLYARK